MVGQIDRKPYNLETMITDLVIVIFIDQIQTYREWLK